MNRSKERVLTVTAKSADIKAHKQRHADKKTFGDVAKDWGQKSGLSDVKIADELARIERQYWAMAEKPDMTMRALASELSQQGTSVTHDTVWRFVRRQGLTGKRRDPDRH